MTSAPIRKSFKMTSIGAAALFEQQCRNVSLRPKWVGQVSRRPALVLWFMNDGAGIRCFGPNERSISRTITSRTSSIGRDTAFAIQAKWRCMSVGVVLHHFSLSEASCILVYEKLYNSLRPTIVRFEKPRKSHPVEQNRMAHLGVPNDDTPV